MEVVQWGLLDGTCPLVLPTKCPQSIQPASKLVPGGWLFSLVQTTKGVFGWGSNSLLEKGSSGLKEVQLPDQLRLEAAAAGRSHWVMASATGVYQLRSAPSVKADIGSTQGERARLQLASPNTREPADLRVTSGGTEQWEVQERRTGLELVAILADQNIFPKSASVRSLAAGEHHTVLVLVSGDAFAWGNGKHGQLGNGTRVDSSRPRKISFLPHTRPVQVEQGPPHTFPQFMDVACGSLHTLLVGRDDVVYSCGWGLYGQCGTGGTEDMLHPTPVVGLSGLDCRGVGAGLAHSACTTKQGDVYTWGWNQAGQLGTGGEALATIPQLVESKSLDGVVRGVSLGARHTVAITIHGDLYSWGWNRFGQLGVGDYDNRQFPTKVAIPKSHVAVRMVCGWWHTCAELNMKTAECEP